MAQTGKERWPDLPDVPTLEQAGIANAVVDTSQMFLAPAGTPAPIISKVYQQAAKIALDPEMKAKLAELGLDAVADPPDTMAGIIKADTVKWAKVIRDANIKAAQ